MANLLRGTYKLEKKTKTSPKKSAKKSKSSEFESASIEKLGGSIAFVSKSGLLWSGDDEKDSK